MKELLYKKSEAVAALNRVDGFHPMELERKRGEEGKEEGRGGEGRGGGGGGKKKTAEESEDGRGGAERGRRDREERDRGRQRAGIADAADALRVRHSEPLFIFDPATFSLHTASPRSSRNLSGCAAATQRSAVTSDTTAIMTMRTVVNILAPLNLSFCGLNPFWSIAPE